MACKLAQLQMRFATHQLRGRGARAFACCPMVFPPNNPRPTGDLAAKLSGIAALHPAVRIGSYPNVDMGLGEAVAGRPYKVRRCGRRWRGVEARARKIGRAAKPCPQPLGGPSAFTAVLRNAQSSAPLLHVPPQVKLQFESRDSAALQKAVEAVRGQLDVFTLPS